MQTETRSARITLEHKMTLAHAAVTVTAALLAEVIALIALAAVGRPTFTLPTWRLHTVIVAAGAGLVGLALGAWASRRVCQRLRRALEISRAWMRGNLSLRIADPQTDELGQLARQLNLLAEHLEDDEQDLDELRERNARLTDQVSALAVVEERNRLARELHDSVKQHLFSLAMTASGFRARFDALEDAPPDLIEVAQEIETAAQTAQREMTRLIKDLKPDSLQEQGLADALNDYTLLFGAREHILIYLEVQGNDALLPPAVAEALYRVAQEALHNVAHHARATRTDVHLRCIPEQVSLTVKDNGIGFDASQAQRGMGLENMRERLMEVGGALTIESQPGIGTMVVAEVGLPYPWGGRSEFIKRERGRPIPTIENWAWLGQKLVIPVGQTWPWLPADQAHLRRPLVEAAAEEPLTIRSSAGFLGFRRNYVLQFRRRAPLVRVYRGRLGYEWETNGVSWALRRIRGLGGRMVLTRNEQPLAAIQQRGRLLHTWSEIVYDGRGYRLSQAQGRPRRYVLTDETGDELLSMESNGSRQLKLRRALPLPLLVIVAMCAADEMATVAEATEAVEEV